MIGIYRQMGKVFMLVCCFSSSSMVEAEANYSPYANQNLPMNLYWGDTHLHTNMSQDSGTALFTNKRLSPVEAYQFSRGETVTTYTGMKLRRQRPLDFLVIADHAENIGLNVSITENDKFLMNDGLGKKLIQAYEESKKTGLMGDFFSLLEKKTGNEKVGGKPFLNSVWNKITEYADEYNKLENFTAFIAYEWTSWGPNPDVNAQLHRVVIFKDGAEKTQKFLPYSQFDSSRPEDLWDYLSRYERETGGDALAIPHNGNLSNGYMFMLENSSGHPLNESYAKNRSRWEPLFEVTQIKGDSETHPYLSPNDEFADYETFLPFMEVEPIHERRQYEYARSGLKLGLSQQSKLGLNPFKFGMVGGTDAHGSFSAVAENNFNGKGYPMEPSKKRLAEDYIKGGEYEGVKLRAIPSWQLNAAGYAAVWAHENTRESLFAAMKRKEVYATTGPRMTVRFFGGWNYQADDAMRPSLATIGYSKGVPMGGDLSHAPKDKVPSFLIRALKDPDGANLDRIQVVKGWHDKKGALHEKVHNVALSDKRQTDAEGKASLVGSTVNFSGSSYTNSIGSAELAVVWEDLDFNRNELAFYYVRVLEIPTPRWPAYDANVFQLNDLPKEIPMITQERAYTSPIWYSPK